MKRTVRSLPVMDTTQAMDSATTVENSYLREELRKRRERLTQAIALAPGDATLTDLTVLVDEALARMDAGTYGICEQCHETVERERLLIDPLARVCLDHLSAPERRALESDLELASRVQRGLLPAKDLRVGGWSAHYHYSPLGAVSGDYVDLIVPENESGTIVFAVGDVSGKGVAASMLMTHLSAMLRSLVSVGMPTDQLLRRMNCLVADSAIAGQFVTLVVGRADAFGDVEIASAGHPPALCIQKGAAELIHSTAVPIGMFREINPSLRRLKLEDGETLVLYTDGISEQTNPAGQEFGTNRLVEVVASHHSLEPAALVDACLDHLSAFQSGATRVDDQTLLALRRGL